MGKTMVASTPLGRIGQPDDIARIAIFLASDDQYNPGNKRRRKQQSVFLDMGTGDQ
jgi:NAD(P)-dependent dehydrogenase (short-subunit alcohol dehydrogenase family)